MSDDRPPLSDFDLSRVNEPEDGILYLYRSHLDGFWCVDSDADIALQEATGIPVGEIQDLEWFDDDLYGEGERGELIAIHLNDEPLDQPPDDDERFGLRLQTRDGHPVKLVLMDADGEYLDLTHSPEGGYYVYENDSVGVTAILEGDDSS